VGVKSGFQKYLYEEADATKINVEQIFKLLSLGTEVKSL